MRKFKSSCDGRRRVPAARAGPVFQLLEAPFDLEEPRRAPTLDLAVLDQHNAANLLDLRLDAPQPLGLVVELDDQRLQENDDRPTAECR